MVGNTPQHHKIPNSAKLDFLEVSTIFYFSFQFPVVKLWISLWLCILNFFFGITQDYKDGLLWRVLSFFSLIFPVPRQKMPRVSAFIEVQIPARNPASTSQVLMRKEYPGYIGGQINPLFQIYPGGQIYQVFEIFCHIQLVLAKCFPSTVSIWMQNAHPVDANNLPVPGRKFSVFFKESFDFCQCRYLNVACVCVCLWKTKFLESTFCWRDSM